MRLFVALVPPEALRRMLEGQGKVLRDRCMSGRMVPWENIHLTLAFLGETGRLQAVERAMKSSAGASFSLRTASPGRFPGKKGDLWWVGVEESPPLRALRRRLVRALEEEGVWLDDAKPFQAHLTLGRNLRPLPGADLTVWTAACPVSQWRVEELTLMESRRTSGGSLRYIPLLRCPLSGEEKKRC